VLARYGPFLYKAGVFSITVTGLLEPRALEHLCGERGLKKQIFKERRMWHFPKRSNSGALPHCTVEVFEFADVSSLYLIHIDHVSPFP